MREFNKDAQTPDIGHLIGFDFFRYGWDINRNDDLQQLNPQLLEPIIHGYKEAEHTKTSQHRHPNYFQRKLLQIRARAYRKGIGVSITESDIEKAYHFTHQVCPATQKPLTMGTGEDTDFSVDRVDNDKGYEADNIFVMSSYANQAKDDISLEELMTYASCNDSEMTDEKFPRFSAMHPDEWVRLYFWIAGFMPDELVDKTSYRLVKELKQISFVTESFYFFLFLAYAAQPKKAFLRELDKSKIIKTYTSSPVLNERQRTRLRKSAVKHAAKHFQIMDTGQGMVTTISRFMRMESIQDIFDILNEQLKFDLLADDPTRRVWLIKELFHRKYREQMKMTT